MDIKKVNIGEALAKVTEHWDPHILGELNAQQVKIAKLKGDFVWHHHENEDELFLVIKGHLKIALEDKTISLLPGEFVVIPKGVNHKPIANEEVEVLLFEPKSTLNTGNINNELTKKDLKQL